MINIFGNYMNFTAYFFCKKFNLQKWIVSKVIVSCVYVIIFAYVKSLASFQELSKCIAKLQERMNIIDLILELKRKTWFKLNKKGGLKVKSVVAWKQWQWKAFQRVVLLIINITPAGKRIKQQKKIYVSEKVNKLITTDNEKAGVCMHVNVSRLDKEFLMLLHQSSSTRCSSC